MRAAEDSTIPTPTAPEVASRVVVELTGIRKSFGSNEVLKGVDLAVHAGEHVVVFGPSGSGKSTLLRTINLLEPPTAGSVKVDGKEYAEGGSAIELRRTVGMVFQQFNLFPNMTVLQNLTEAPIHVLGKGREEAEQEARALLERVGLEAKVDAHPTQLSGGQQQRVAIARALAMGPKILLLDEVTAALDPELVAGVLNLLREIADTTDITMLIVTHEMHFARDVSHRVMMFDSGQIVEQGPPEKIFGACEHDRTRRFLHAVIEER
jgi:polar amino acid transport system ATP-binding protein